jgi:hypothetical protein
MPTGGFVGSAPITRASGNAGANSIFLTAVSVQQSGTATAVLLDGFGATASTTIKGLVYDGAHSVLLASSAAFTAIANNYNRFALTSPLAVTAGTYYVGYVCSTSATVTIQSSGGSSWFASGGQSVTTPANPLAAGVSNANPLMIALELDGSGSSGFGFGTDQSTGVTLSSSNTVATFATTASRGARSTVTQVPGTGKWYAEVLVGGTLSNPVAVGLAAASWGVTQAIGQRAYVAWLPQSGTLQGSSSTTALGLTYVSGDVVGIAYDAVNNLVWFNKNNGSFFGASSSAGNPAAGTGGAAVQATPWPVAVSAGTSNTAGSAVVFTLRDTAGALQYTPPSGFSAWSAATYPALAAARQYAVTVNAG